MQRIKKTLSLEIPIEFWANENIEVPQLDKLAVFIRYNLTDWCDGRYSFIVEKFYQSINEIAKQGLSNVVEDDCHKKYGNKQIETENGSYSLSYAESEKINQKIYACVGDADDIKVSLVNVEKE